MPKVSAKHTQPDTAPDTAPDGATDPVADPIAGRIRALRRGANLTAAKLDRLTGLGAGTIGRLERGDQKLYANHLYRIARAIGVDIGWFYREGGRKEGAPPTASDAPGATALDLEKQRLLDAYMRIQDPGLKRDVFELVETLAKAAKG